MLTNPSAPADLSVATSGFVQPVFTQPGWVLGTGTYALSVTIVKEDVVIWEYHATKEAAEHRAREILMDGVEHHVLFGNRTDFYPPHRIKKITVSPQQQATITTTPYVPSQPNIVYQAPAVVDPNTLADVVSKAATKHNALIGP